MMIHIPGLTDKGIITEKLTEFVDLFPTLVDAAGLPPLKMCPRNSTTVKVGFDLYISLSKYEKRLTSIKSTN